MRQLRTFASIILLLVHTCAIEAGALPTTGNAQEHGGRLVIALNNIPTHLNPAVSSGTLTGLVGSQIFAGLIHCDSQGRPHPYLARSWEYSADGLVLTLHLREEALFHDGTPVTSRDVIFSIQTVQQFHPFTPMLAAIDSLEAPDDHTVIVRLRYHHPALLQIFTTTLTPILPAHIYADGQNIRTHPANWAPVGAGPFRFTAYQPGRRIVLERFDRFFLEGRPFLDTVEFELFAGPSEILMAMEAGEVHLTGFSPLADHHEQFARNKHLVVSTEGLDGIGAMLWIGFNLRQTPFNDRNVRRALALAIDREFITRHILRGSSMAMDGPLVPSSPFYAAPESPSGVDLDEANRLLDEAGYKRDNTGKRMTIQMDYPPNAVNLALPLIKYLRHHLSRTVGIDLSIRKNRDDTEWANHVTSGDYQATLDIVFTWGDPVIGVHRTYHSANIRPGVMWSNTQAYSNIEVDRLLDLAERETSPVLRKKLYADFQRIVRDDQPIFWLATMPYATIHDRRLKGLNESFWGLLGPMDGVFWETERP